MTKSGTQNILPGHIREAIDKACLQASVVCVGVDVRGQDKQLKLEVAIDTPEGVTHDHCRAVSANIDEAIGSDEWYSRLRAIDISSPGAESPAQYIWQLNKHVSRTVNITDVNGLVQEGVLVEVGDDFVVIQPSSASKSKAEKPAPVTLTWDAIKSIHVVIRF